MLTETDLTQAAALRHDFHAHPELAFQERRTSARIAEELTRLGVEHRTGIATTGVVAHLPAVHDGAAIDAGPAVALRADIDALPIVEQTGAPYTSTHTGVMHACGHDGHTAILLGVARVLARMNDRPNPVTLIFQPAEEGGGGAEIMCREGVLEGGIIGPACSRIFGLHGWPQLIVGTVATRPGPLLAATDDLDITIRGTQAHGAYPHLGSDTILAGAHVVSALQSFVSRRVSPLDSAVVSIGSFVGGTANNILPAEVRMEGTIRTLRDATRELARRRVPEIIRQAAAALGCEADVVLQPGYPVTSNDPAMTEHFLSIARETLGADRVLLAPEPGMGGEDFSYYGQRVPACFFLLGVCPVGENPASQPQLHQPTFNFNDDALRPGIELMLNLALARA